VGAESYVLPIGGQLEASVITNNLVRIADGDIMHQGRHITIPKDTYDEVEIVNGLQGMKRNDLIVVRYTKDATTNIENASLVVIQGTSTDGTPDDPEYNDNSILDGTLISDMPLYRISLDGLTVGEPEKLFSTTKSINLIGTEVEALKKDVDDINSNLNHAITMDYDANHTITDLASFIFNSNLIAGGGTFRGVLLHGSMWRYEGYSLNTSEGWCGSVHMEQYNNNYPVSYTFSVFKGTLYGGDSNLAVETIPLTMENGWTSESGYAYAYKYGKILFASLMLIAPSTITRTQTIFTLPSDIIPFAGCTRIQLRKYSASTDAIFGKFALWTSGIFTTDNNYDSGVEAGAKYQGHIIALLK